ncbi:MAG: C_GCAxxG_C_C family protein [Prolixibacteraceae bacterium]|nr:C_GCAxxG_C_C family protein [Prolixibacteraceae bacterium]MBN2648488.1 C_GCAxxG_C_C family protein [Prolixibacteraceae bacterium]
MKPAEQAQKYFADNFSCSQSVLAAFAPNLGLSVDDSLKVACAFGAGMGRTQQTCGAVTGALMALGLKYGKGINDNNEKKEQTFAMTKILIDKFAQIHGSVNCRELLDGLNMNISDELECIQKEKMFETRCPNYVATAAQLVEQLFKAD